MSSNKTKMFNCSVDRLDYLELDRVWLREDWYTVFGVYSGGTETELIFNRETAKQIRDALNDFLEK